MNARVAVCVTAGVAAWMRSRMATWMPAWMAARMPARMPARLAVRMAVVPAPLPLALLFLLGMCATTAAQPAVDAPSPEAAAGPRATDPEAPGIGYVTDLIVEDKPLDAGRALRVSFGRAPGDTVWGGTVTQYDLLRRELSDTAFVVIRSFPGSHQESRFSTEDTGVRPGRPYLYMVRAMSAAGAVVDGPEFGPVKSTREWFFTNKLNTLIAVAIFVVLVMGYIRAARKGRNLFIRRIAGLDAIDEAVGRCTEMGRPTLYIPGIASISDVATIASLNILGQVAKKIASYQARILVPNRDPIVYPITQDIVRQGFLEAGYPDMYRDEDVYFVTNDQFSYAAAVAGTMVRERPGANLLLGMFYAEALILAETGASVGSIQIAGTDSISQLPFFVTACDYTIIGEELYAASSYIAREPTLLGSLKGQDMYKLIVIILIIVGVAAMTIGVLVRGEPFTWVADMLRVRATTG